MGLQLYPADQLPWTPRVWWTLVRLLEVNVPSTSAVLLLISMYNFILILAGNHRQSPYFKLHL